MAGSTPETATLNCPACDLPIPVRGMGRTTTLVCGACGTIIDTSDQRIRIVQRFQEELVKPLLPLGKRGKIGGTEYEILGFLVRCDRSGVYAWEEYLLLNPYKGFAWLVQAEGHWSFLTGIKDTPEDGIFGLRYNRRKFKKFINDTPRVVSVLGEFYWEVSTGDEVQTTDYIAPPYLLSREEGKNEVSWSHGYYLSKRDVERAFGLKSTLPRPRGIAMNQPNPWRRRAFEACLMSLGAAVVMFLIHTSVAPDAQKLVFQREYLFDSTSPASKKVSSDEFVVSGKRTNLRVRANAPVDNTWLDFDLTLMNLDTGAKDEAELELAYYHGTDSDGAWNEGDQTEDIFFASVDAGRYSLVAEVSTDESPEKPPTTITYSLVGHQGIATDGNLIMGIFILILAPCLCFLGIVMFESARWRNAEE